MTRAGEPQSGSSKGHPCAALFAPQWSWQSSSHSLKSMHMMGGGTQMKQKLALLATASGAVPSSKLPATTKAMAETNVDVRILDSSAEWDSTTCVHASWSAHGARQGLPEISDLTVLRSSASDGGFANRQPFTSTVGVPRTPNCFPRATPFSMRAMVAADLTHLVKRMVSVIWASAASSAQDFSPRESCFAKTTSTKLAAFPASSAHSTARAAGRAKRCDGKGKWTKTSEMLWPKWTFAFS